VFQILSVFDLEFCGEEELW